MQTIGRARCAHVYVDKQVLFVELANADSRNALSSEDAELLWRVFIGRGEFSATRLVAKNKIGAVLVYSSLDGIFASGGHLKELSTMNRAKGTLYASRMRMVCKRLGKVGVPTVTLLGGGAYGGGSELALATDFRWCTSRSAALHFWQSKWAVPGGWNGMVRLQELVPQWNARKVGLQFALQSSLTYSDLLTFGLFDVNFAERAVDAQSAAMEDIERLAAQFLRCEKSLREALVARTNTAALSRADESMFNKFWLGKAHRTLLQAFLEKKS